MDHRRLALTCRSLVTRAFSPSVSVMASEDCDEVCRELGFESTLDMLRPFGDRISGRVTVRDSQSMSRAFDDFCIRFIKPVGVENNSSVDDIGRGDDRTSSDTSVEYKEAQETQLFDTEDLEKIAANIMTESGDVIDRQRSDEVYLEYFRRIVASHSSSSAVETFNHPVAGIIAVSSRNQTPIETLSMLYKQSDGPFVPEYLNREYLRYYVLIHDERGGSLDKSIALYEKMKRHFGLHCHMVRIGRDREQTPDDSVCIGETEWLTAKEKVASIDRGKRTIRIHSDDHTALTAFARELTLQSIVPFMERSIATWNDQVASSKRRFASRFFSVGKKYLTGASRGSGFPIPSLSGTPTSATNTPASSRSPTPPVQAVNVLRGNFNITHGWYSYLTSEAIIRKLGDFAFMLRDYKFAYATYDLLKRDLHNDKAWAHLAACQEMATVSLLMHAEPSLSVKTRLDTIDPLLDSATYSYESRCSLPDHALRCIVVSSELLQTVNSPSAAADGATRWILKALNDRLVGRLGYAMLMERISAAYYVYDVVVASIATSKATPGNGGTPIGPVLGSTRKRKAAFWGLLAAREWTDANTPSRALLCISDATKSVYGNLEWSTRADGLLGRLTRQLEQ